MWTWTQLFAERCVRRMDTAISNVISSREIQNHCLHYTLWLMSLFRLQYFKFYLHQLSIPTPRNYFSPFPLWHYSRGRYIDYASRYSDWLRAGRRRGQSSSPGRVKNFLFSKSSRPALLCTQPPIQWVPDAFPRGKAAGAWSWPLTSS
jgi:hypothetical protein